MSAGLSAGASAQTILSRLGGTVRSFVGDSFVDAGTGTGLELVNPATEEVIGVVDPADGSVVDLEAGLPGGLVNVVAGGGDVGAAITEHPGIEGITFIGSIANGRRVNQAAAATMKKVTLELGGKTPSIVFGDADLDEALQC